MKQLKPRDKITQKMTRDGAVEINETQQTAERISSREADSDFSQPDTATAERVMEHLDAAHTRKANKKAVKKAQKAAVLRTSTSRLQFTDEERATPELQPYIKKSEKAADKLDAAKAAIPKQKKLVKERTFEEATGKAKTRLHFEEQETPIPVSYTHLRVLSDYYHLLHRWKEEYATRQPDEAWNPRFTEALQNMSRVEYLSLIHI